MKSRTTSQVMLIAIGLSVVLAAKAQTTSAEEQANFEALLEQNRESMSGTGVSGDIEVMEIEPSVLYRDIDGNRAEIDSLRSEIEILRARKELESLRSELLALENGGDIGQQRNRQADYTDSTMRLPGQGNLNQENSQLDEQITNLQGNIETLEGSITTRLDSFLTLIEGADNEATSGESDMQPDVNDKRLWSLVATRGSAGNKEAEIINILGESFNVKAGQKINNLTVKEIAQRKVQAIDSDGKPLEITPRNLTNIDPSIYSKYQDNGNIQSEQPAGPQSLVDRPAYSPVNDSTR